MEAGGAHYKKNRSMFKMETAEFYKEEIRCGWRVDEKTKRIWAVQLEMLERWSGSAKKYGLKYFADSGTLIGAVRHQGIYSLG